MGSLVSLISTGFAMPRSDTAMMIYDLFEWAQEAKFDKFAVKRRQTMQLVLDTGGIPADLLEELKKYEKRGHQEQCDAKIQSAKDRLHRPFWNHETALNLVDARSKFRVDVPFCAILSGAQIDVKREVEFYEQCKLRWEETEWPLIMEELENLRIRVQLRDQLLQTDRHFIQLQIALHTKVYKFWLIASEYVKGCANDNEPIDRKLLQHLVKQLLR